MRSRATEADRLALARLLDGCRQRFAITQPGDPARMAQILQHQPQVYVQYLLPELEETCSPCSRDSLTS